MRCSIGEISDAMEKVFKRHVATDRTASGAYTSEYGNDKEIDAVMESVEVNSTVCLYDVTWNIHF